MYQILLNNQDGQGDQVLYSDSESGLRRVLSPTGTTSIDSTPTFDFTILPDHPLYESITKFKSVVTVKRNERVLFYGRVLGDNKDFYGQKQIACEGALSFLLDSVQAPLSETTETPAASFRRLINAHNSQMETFKRFTVGQITVDKASSSKKFKIESYQDTRGVIESQLIDEYKGYLRARYESGTLYIDWLKNFGRTNSQPIKMAVNLLDKNTEEVADDYYTVLLPIGNNKKDISSVNNGSKYLRDETSIAKYGVIIHPESFDAKTPETLLTKAQEAMQKRSGALPFSAKLKLVDMKLLGLDVDEIQIGDVMSNVEGFSESLTVAEISYDLFNPENDEYTLENQAAIDKRHSSEGGKGTISSRVGGSGAINYERYIKQKDTLDEVELNVKNMTFNVDKFKILAGDLDVDSAEIYEDYTEEQVGELRRFKSASFRLLPQEIADTVQEITGVRLDEDHKPMRLDDQSDYIYTDSALAISSRVKRTSTELTSTVGAIGIQIDPTTGRAIKDSNGNYINVEVDAAGFPIIPYRIIDFPEGSVLSRVKQTEDAWVAEVRDRTNADNQLRGAIEVNANKVSMIVTATDQEGYEINRAAVIASINGDGSYSSVKIDANVIKLGDDMWVDDAGNLTTRGLVKAETIFSEDATHNDIYANDMYGDSITLSGTGLLTCESVVSEAVTALSELYLGEVDMGDAVVGISVDPNPPSGKIGFLYTKASGGDPVAINFNIADTAKYQSDVGISSLVQQNSTTDPREYDTWTGDSLGVLGANTYYLIRATPNHGAVKQLKFKTPAGSSGTITGISRQPDPTDTTKPKADAYSTTTKKYTVYLQASGSGITNSPYPTTLEVDGIDAYNHGRSDGDESNVTVVGDISTAPTTTFANGETEKIKLISSSKTSNNRYINAKVAVTLSNGTRYIRTITDISNGSTYKVAMFNAVWDDRQNKYVAGSQASAGLYRVGSG